MDQPNTAEPMDRLKDNSLGLVDVIFMAVATAAPITAMSGNVPVAVGFGVGSATPATYVVATIVLTIFASAYVAMARYVTSTGAFYGFVSRGIGRVVGLGVGYLVTFAYSVFEVAIIGIFSYFGHNAFESQFGIDIPWPVFAAVGLAINALMSYFDISIAAKLLSVLLLTEIAILSILGVSVLVQGGGPDGLMVGSLNPAHLLSGNGVVAAAPGLALFMAFWSWSGFESTVMYGEESRNPRRIIPIATLVAVTGTGIFYVFISWMTVAGNGAEQAIARATSADPLALFFAPTEAFVGNWAVVTFQWLMMTGSLACALAFHNCAARYGYALGREGLLPKALGRTHRTHSTPHNASNVQTVVALIWLTGFWVMGRDPYLDVFVLLAILGTFCMLLVQTVTMAAVWNFFRVNDFPENAWRTTFAPILGGLGMAGVVVLMLQNLHVAAGPASTTLFFKLVPYIVGVLFVTGVAVALHLRRTAPDRYALIGHVSLGTDSDLIVDDEQETVEIH